MLKTLNLLIVVPEPSPRFENSVRKSVIKEIPNDQNPTLYRIDVIFWKDESSSKNHFLKMLKKFQPGFIVLKEYFLRNEVETIEHIIETNKRHCLKKQAHLKLFKVSEKGTIKTPGIKTISQLSDIIHESI